jgi:hypothetical protein
MTVSASGQAQTAPERLRFKGLTVPYVTCWSGEKLLRVPPLRRTPDGLAFQDESPYDRDPHGVLRLRMNIARGRGKPQLGDMHALRQRRAMLDLLCQVCSRSCPDLDARRTLFFALRTPIREEDRTLAPPVCPPCAIESAEACPKLREGCVLAWVERPESWGVAGDAFDPKTLRWIPSEDMVYVPYGSPAARWTIGVQVVVSLHGVTPASWDEVHDLAARIEPAPVREVAA